MTLSTPCLTHARLREIALGDISAVQAESWGQHLVECPNCSAAMARLMDEDPLVKMIFEVGWPPIQDAPELESLCRRIAEAVDTRLNEALDTIASTPIGYKLDLSWLSPSDSPDQLGRLGNFNVLRLLGRGGMGAVFEAEDNRLQRRVALKVMLSEVSADSSMKDRFLREARSAAAVHHRNVVTIFEVGESNNVPHLVMELLRGESLSERLQRESRLATLQAVNITAQVADGLSAAHQQGLLHRDIKPGNIWLESADISDPNQPINVKILDFGLAKSIGVDDGLTRTGALIGTLRYLSPEQARGEKLDARSDLFSLGCMLYQMLSGEFPFEGIDLLSQLHALATAEPIAIQKRVADIPDSLADLIQRMLARNADERPASAIAIATELRRISQELEHDAIAKPIGAALKSPKPSDPRRVGFGHRTGILAAFLGVSLIMLGVLFITIYHRDGSKTHVEIGVRDDSIAPGTATPSSNTNPNATPMRTHAETHRNETAVERNEPRASNHLANPAASETSEQAKQSAFSLLHLNAASIAETERFNWQPKELVAVVGEHQWRHWGRVMQIRFHPSGRYFISIPDLGPANLWMLSNLKESKDAFSAAAAYGLSAQGVEFSQDGAWLSSANVIFPVDTSDPDRPRVLPPIKLPSQDNQFGTSDVAIYDSRWLIMASDRPGELKLWDISGRSGRFVKSVQINAQVGVRELAWSDDGSRLVAPCGDGNVRIWDVNWTEADNPMFTLHDMVIPGGSSVLLKRGSVLAAGGDGNGKISLWDISKKPFKPLQSIPGGHNFSFAPDGKQVAVAAGLGIQLYAEQDSEWEAKQLLTGGMAAVISLAWSPDQKTLAAGDQFGGVHLWDMSVNPPQLRSPHLPGSNIRSLTIAPNGKSMIVMGSDMLAVRWDLTGQKPTRNDWTTYCDPVHPAAYSPDSRLVRVHDHVWDMSQEPPARVSDSISVLSCFVPSSRNFLALDQSMLVKETWSLTNRGRFIIESDSNSKRVPLTGIASDAIDTLQFQSQRFATRSDDNTVCVWSVSEYEKPLYELRHNLKFGNSSRPLVLSPDGKVLLMFSQGESLVWDLEESPPRRYPLQLDPRASGAVFSADSKQLFVGDGLGVGVFDWVNNREIRRMNYPGPVRQIVLHPDQLHLATVNGNGTVYFLRIAEMQGK